MLYVIVVGSIGEGIEAIWGPFDSADAAVEWAGCNPISDLRGVSWEVVPMGSPHEDTE